MPRPRVVPATPKKRAPQSAANTNAIGFRADAKLRAEIFAAAAADGRPVSQWIVFNLRKVLAAKRGR